MRDRWYSDNRDLVKWAALVHLAKEHNLETILQVAFYRPEANQLRLETPNGSVPFPAVVLEHFRNLEGIEALSQSSNLHIEVFKRRFVADRKISTVKGDFRAEYLGSVLAKIRTYQRRRLLVFLDPDTGIAPQRPGPKHVLRKEIGEIFGAIKPDDWLVLYQHARRHKNWKKTTLDEFLAALGGGSPDRVRTFSCRKLGRDVAFFAVEKT